MNLSSHPDAQNNSLNSILQIIHEIVEKSESGDYIYRGEPEHYQKVSSTLYRVFSKFNVTNFNEDVVPNMLEELKVYASEYTNKTDNFEILTALQHYGGKTNLIDFTTDCLTALFFACDRFHDKDGRIILQNKTGIIKDWIEDDLQNPQNRVIAQKSVFVSPPKGFIEPDQGDVITVPAALKKPLLDYLKKFHGISTETIYNDIHGFIRWSAYAEFCEGLTYQNRQEYENAVKHYTQAIVRNPKFVEAYVNRGIAYYNMDKYNSAIEDYKTAKALELKPHLAPAVQYNLGNAYREKGEYNEAIKVYEEGINLNPDFAHTYYNNMGLTHRKKGEYEKAIEAYNKAIQLKDDYDRAYCNRGEAWLHLEKWEKARKDLTTAENMGYDIIASFHNAYASVEDFKQKTGIQLPEDIAEMLTPR